MPSESRYNNDGANDGAQVQTPAVELERVCKAFEGEPVVRELSLTVERGEFLFLLGPSGCGKTTTLRLIAGLEQASSGTIRLDGRVVDGVPTYRRNTAMVFQNWCLFPHKTVYDNVAFGLRMRRQPRGRIRARVEEALALVELKGYGARMPAQLSGGEQQRVALARALVVQPAVLLLDEPLSNLDQRLRQQMRLELRHIQRAVGVTTVFVTHDPVEALSTADRVAILRAGRLEQIGTPADIYERPATEFVAGFTGEVNRLAGEVVSQRAGRAVIRVDPLEIQVHTTGLVPGQDVSVTLRPNHVRLLNGAGDALPNAFPGTVEHTAYLGDAVRCYVRLSDRVTVLADCGAPQGDRIPGVGDAVTVGWEADRCLCFPRTNGGD